MNPFLLSFSFLDSHNSELCNITKFKLLNERIPTINADSIPVFLERERKEFYIKVLSVTEAS